MSILRHHPLALLLTAAALFTAHALVDVQAFVAPNHPCHHHACNPSSLLVWPVSFSPLSFSMTRRWASYRSSDNDEDNDAANENDKQPSSSTTTSTLTRVDGDGPLSSLTSSLLDRLPQNLDFLSNVNLERFQKNVLGGGPVGERGEVYTIAQLIVMVCVLGGGVPVIGNWILPLLGPVCLATGLGVLLVALNHMGSTNSLSPWPKPVDDGTLLTDGMFAQVRHPLYSSALLLCVGWSLVTDSATRLLLTALLWYVLEIKSNVEEDELLKKYPQQYADYQKQVTGKFLPNEFIHHLVSSVMSNKRE